MNRIKKEKVQWVFIATPNRTHYKIAKECIDKKINVFCEKPLCLKANQAKKLINLSKRKKVKLFVSDLYNFYSSKFKKIEKNNFVFRSKFVKKSDKEFFYRFMYHDISILYKFLKKNELLKCFIIKDDKKKYYQISIELKNKKNIKFIYHLKNNKKSHIINNIHIKSKKDFLKEMIKKVLNNNIDFKENNTKAVFIIEYLNKIQEKLKYVH